MEENKVSFETLREDAKKLIEDLKSVSEDKGEEAKKKLEEAKKDLDEKLDQVQQKIIELKEAGGAASIELREGVDKALDALKESFKAAKEKFEEHK